MADFAPPENLVVVILADVVVIILVVLVVDIMLVDGDTTVVTAANQRAHGRASRPSCKINVSAGFPALVNTCGTKILLRLQSAATE